MVNVQFQHEEQQNMKETAIFCTRTLTHSGYNITTFCELKGGNIGIVEKAQETRFDMS